MAFVIILYFRYKALVTMLPVVKADHNFIYTQITTAPATNIDTHQIWLDFQDLISNILTEEILILFSLILGYITNYQFCIQKAQSEVIQVCMLTSLPCLP